MKSNTISLGGISITDKVEKDFGFFSDLFRGISDKAKYFEGRAI